MKNKFKALHLSSLLLYESYCAFIYCFGSYMLLEKGFTATAAGIIMSMANLLGFILQPLISNFVDNSKKFSIFEVAMFVMSFGLLSTIINYTFTSPSFISAIAYIGLLSAGCSIESLFNSFHFVMIENGYPINFGFDRALGSISYALSSSLLGVLFDKTSLKTGLLTGAILCGITVVVLFILSISSKSFKSKPEKEDTISYKEFLTNHKIYVLVIICLVCIFYSYTLVDNFLIIVLNDIGGSSQDLGNIMCVKALLEAPTFFMFSKLEAKFNIKSLLMFSSFMMALKSLLVFTASSPLLIYIIQILQSFGFALLTPSMISYVNKIMNKKEAVRGQALYTMSITIGSIFSSFSSGFLFDNLGSKGTVLLSAIVCTIAATMFSILLRRKDA